VAGNVTARFKKCKQLFQYKHSLLLTDISGLYYKHITIVIDTASVVSKCQTKL